MLEISIELQRALKHKSKLRPTGGTHRALQAQPATRDVISLKQSSGGLRESTSNRMATQALGTKRPLVSEAQLPFQRKGESHASKRKVSCPVAPPRGTESQGLRGVQNASIWMATDCVALLPNAHDKTWFRHFPWLTSVCCLHAAVLCYYY